MALPFLSGSGKRRDQVLAIDLGSRTTKAVLLQRRGEVFSIAGYTLQDAPSSEKGLTPDLLGSHLAAVAQSLGARGKQAVLVVGVADSLLRQAEMPMVPVADMRVMLKFNSKNYLQQELSDHVFDCFLLPAAPGGGKADAGKPPAKLRVLVGGARKQLIDDLQAAAKIAGIGLEEITLGLVGPANAFERAAPEVFARDAVALVDIGFRNTSISILLNGELMLTRVVAIGGDRLTAGISESLGVGYAEAEGIKVGLPDEVQSAMMALLAPLGRELRASIDFFEHQNDKAVTQVLVSGGSARSAQVLQILQTELLVPCATWNPTSFLQLGLPPQQLAELEQIAPQLSVAVGAGVAAL